LQALVGDFFLPARSALVPNLVPEAGLLAANSLNQTSQIIAGLLGTAAAGVLFAMLQAPWIAFAIDSLTFFVSVGLLALLRVPKRERPANLASVGVVLGELRTGLGLIARSRVLLGVLVAAGVAMLGFGAVNVLLVPLVVNDLRVPETWFAGLQGAQTASMILSGGLVALLATRFRPTSIVSVAMLALGALVALIALITAPWQLALILFAVGWFMTPLQASIATLTQTTVSDEVRGRVGAALNTLISTAGLLSMAFAGIFGAWLGVRNVFVLAGIIAVLAGLGSALLFRGTAVARRVVPAG
jgi:MFS family permease